MWLLHVLIEHASLQLDRPFSYVYEGSIKHRRGFRVLVTFNHQKLVGYVLDSEHVDQTIAQLQATTSHRLLPIDALLDEEPLLNEELLQLALELAHDNFWPRISVLQAMLPLSLKPKKTALKGPKIAYETFVRVIDECETNLTLKQIEWLRIIANEQPFNKRDCRSPSVLQQLLDKGKVDFYRREKRRLSIEESPVERAPQLTSAQQEAIAATLASNAEVYLLQGVTGSGKTEVYLALSERVISAGKTVLMIVPEIALTPMMVAYFLKRFSGKVAILHSELTPGEKYDEYRRIARGEATIVVGARSAVFAPLCNIGLIVLDEEHVETYKQDTLPFYHARDVAIRRGKTHGAKVILGSATPSLESRARALKGVYMHLRLPDRINAMALPYTHIVDMLDPRNIDRESSLFSLKLRQAMSETLTKQEQIVLLINRRGYAPTLSCRQCNHVFKCPTCAIALTYHQHDHMLKCHHCGYLEAYPAICPDCNGTYFFKQGFGTERIVEETKRLFPSARILKLDSDSSKVRQTIARTLKKFANHEADILIGTQMIAKGHDFLKVTLVGLVLADIGLTLPSYRSSERTFQLITQAVGRSGRGQTPGRAIIQTYAPNHYAVTLGATQDYEQFFKTEMYQRKLANYPPYTYLMLMTLSGKSEDLVIQVADTLAHMVIEKLDRDIELLGPSSPYISFLGGVHRRVILIKYKRFDIIEGPIREIVELLSQKTLVRLAVNLDPYDV
ncbi:MAG TPA: primosomal protein N' [Bacilli bacterium]|nr:primosomal protein N' [Bacilli bacterium]